MTFQDEFVGRLGQARGSETGEGGDQKKPLLFRGGDGGGGDASASLASANGGGAERGGLETQQIRSTDRNHPNPVSGETAPSRFRLVRGTDRPDTFEKEGLRGTVYREEHTRHPELVSGPRAAGPEDRGKTDGVESGELAPDNPVRLERSRETGDGAEVSRLRSTRTDRVNASCSALDAEPCRQNTNGPADAQSSASSAEHSRTPRHDGWLPEIRVKFLEALARTGNVGTAAYYVQRSRQSAYDLRRRDPDFARGWQAALVLARDVAEDVLQERAIDGIEEPVYYHGEVVGTRRRYDNRLLLAHLARLDKIAGQVPARRAAARFEEVMEAIRTGADTAPLVAVPTDDELAAAAQAEAPQPPAAEQGDEFYAVTFPDQDGPPDYYRMTPEEAADMEREVPGLTATPTGTRDEAVINALAFEAAALAVCPLPAAEQERNL